MPFSQSVYLSNPSGKAFSNYSPQTLPNAYTQQFSIDGGNNKWILSELPNGRPCMPANQWVPISIIIKFKVISGNVNVNIAAFNNFSNVTGNTQPGKYEFVDKVSTNEHRGAKYKGTASSLPEMESDVFWQIDNSINSNAKLPVKLFNQFRPNGSVKDHWISHANPQADIYGIYDYMPESDLMAFNYSDINKSDWLFDVRHRDGRSQPINGLLSSSQPLGVDACNLGNWGVLTRYTIKINNKGSTKTLAYHLNTASTAIVRYNVGNGNQIKIKTEIDYQSPQNNIMSLQDNALLSPVEARRIMLQQYNEQVKALQKDGSMSICSRVTDPNLVDQEIFTFDVPQGIMNITIEVILPNANSGGFDNYMVVK